MKNHILLTAAVLTLTAMPNFAHAQDAAKDTAKPVEKKASGFGPVDANNDNVVTKAEADAAAGGEFGAFDTDKNGKISKEEFEKLLYKINEKSIPNDEAKKKAAPMITARFNTLDANKDSSISKDEFLADATKRHKMFDENGDGKVTKAEVDAVRVKIEKQMKAMKSAADKKAAEKK